MFLTQLSTFLGFSLGLHIFRRNPNGILEFTEPRAIPRDFFYLDEILESFVCAAGFPRENPGMRPIAAWACRRETLGPTLPTRRWQMVHRVRQIDDDLIDQIRIFGRDFFSPCRNLGGRLGRWPRRKCCVQCSISGGGRSMTLCGWRSSFFSLCNLPARPMNESP